MDYQALLKQLTDPQLLDLAKYCFIEASDRKMAHLYKEIALDQQELDQITAAAYREETTKQINLLREKAAEAARKKAQADVLKNSTSGGKPDITSIWQERKAVEIALHNLGVNKTDWILNVWNGTDKRLYFNDRNRANYVTYYHTGTAKIPPKSIHFENNFTDYICPPEITLTEDLKDKVKSLFTAICIQWNVIEVVGDTIENFDGQPNQKSLDIYLKAINS